MSIHDALIVSFLASDTRAVVYLEQSTETKEYAVKVLQKNTTAVVLATYSLSSALREYAETIAQHTNGFTTWTPL